MFQTGGEPDIRRISWRAWTCWESALKNNGTPDEALGQRGSQSFPVGSAGIHFIGLPLWAPTPT
jgi:hypothetical protein